MSSCLHIFMCSYVHGFMCSCPNKACHRFRGMSNDYLYWWWLQAAFTTLTYSEEQHMIIYIGGDRKLQLQQHPACVPFNMRPYSEEQQKITYILGDYTQYCYSTFQTVVVVMFFCWHEACPQLGTDLEERRMINYFGDDCKLQSDRCWTAAEGQESIVLAKRKTY